jgi:CRP-like cAMP-binding protein
VPTALKVATLKLLVELEESINNLRFRVEEQEIAEAMMKHLTGTVRSMSRHRLLLGIPNASQRVYALLEQMSKLAAAARKLQ